MRFLLINPYYPISETPSPPLGLAYLGAALEAAGIEVKLLDLVVFPYSKKILESVLQDFAPQFVGLPWYKSWAEHERIAATRPVDPTQ